MSLRELWREFLAAQRRWRDENDRDIALAWNTAALIRQQKLPDLRTLLSERGPTPARRQSAEQMRTVLGIMADAYGWPLRYEMKES